jgi:hypothetical protein
MTGDPDACRDLAAYLTGTEAKQLADRLAAGQPLAMATRVVAQTRRNAVRGLLDSAGLADGPVGLTVSVLRAVEGAHSHVRSLSPVWTAPGNLAQHGKLTASLHHYVDRARESVICSTFNFQRSSALWAALSAAAARPEVNVRLYLDTAAADHQPAAWKPTTAEVAQTMRGATVLRTAEHAGQLARNHAKFVAVDHQYLIVTSANFSRSAERLNVELGLVIHDAIVTQAVERQMAAFEPHLYEIVRR